MVARLRDEWTRAPLTHPYQASASHPGLKKRTASQPTLRKILLKSKNHQRSNTFRKNEIRKGGKKGELFTFMKDNS